MQHHEAILKDKHSFKFLHIKGKSTPSATTPKTEYCAKKSVEKKKKIEMEWENMKSVQGEIFEKNAMSYKAGEFFNYFSFIFIFSNYLREEEQLTTIIVLCVGIEIELNFLFERFFLSFILQLTVEWRV